MRRTIRTLTAAALLAAILVPLQAGASRDPSTGWYRVAFDGRITEADRAALVQAGGSALQYSPVNGYVAWLDGREVDAARAIGSVVSVRRVAPAEKIARSLRDETAVALVTAVVHAGSLSGAERALEGIGRITLPGAVQPGAGIADVVLLAPAGAIARIAALPEVLHVGTASPGLFTEDEASDQIQAGNLNAGGSAPVTGYEAWLASRGINGAGVRIAIVDTGLDGNHPDLSGRVAATVNYTDNEVVDTGGHGTHVAGIVGGNASAARPAGGIKDSSGFLYGLGVAPSVQFVSQNAIATTQGDFPPSYGLQVYSRDAVRNGAVAWNASWHTGEGAGVGYIENARVLDIMTRDADWETAGAEPITLVFSAGNGAGTTRTITSPKEAKNIIAVGSSRSARAGSINSISSFSSKGPGRDGRVMPTIAAPGESIVSTRALNPALSCNTPVTDGAGLYASCSGTSMAAPHVAGAVALITQWWKGFNAGANPSPAMNKALLINTATDMGARDIPNRNEGWGRVNIGTLFDPATQRIYVDQSVVLDNLGEEHALDVTPADPTKPMKVTVVWSDAPGAAGQSPALVNDLDLTVTTPEGATYYGNRFVGGISQPDGFPDRLNNMENVYFDVPTAGTYRVAVSAFNLPGDGIPFAGDETDQDFALVISNAVPAA